MPATVALQETVAVPEPVTLLGVIAPQVKPDGTVSVRLTVPLKPPRAVTVIVDVAEVPTVTAAGDDAVIEKSLVVVKVAVAEWDSVPLVPVTVTTNVLGVVALHVKVAVPDPVTLVGVIAPQVRPVGTVSVRLTVPANPFSAVMVIVDTRDWFGLPEGDVAAMVKSWTVKVAVAE